MPRGSCPGHGWRAWQGRLRGCGYRITAARESILEALINAKGKHLSAEDIYIEVHASYPAIGLTTVYRTLELLVDMGFVSKFDFGDGKARYEVIDEDDKESNHNHLVCTKCKRVIDCKELTGEEVEFLAKAQKDLSLKHNFEIQGYLIQFYGICDRCKGLVR